MNKNIIIIFSVLIICATIVGYITMQQVIKDHAVDTCMKIGIVDSFAGNTNNNHTFHEPLMKWFSTCMEKKGYTIQ